MNKKELDHHNKNGGFIMEKSLWQKYNNINNKNSLNKSEETDILIIGSGITGISICYNLRNYNKKIILIDREKLFNQTTIKTTGKITYLQGLVYQKIEKIYGFKAAKLYYESQKEAINIIKNNIKNNNISCDFIKSDSVVFTNDEKEFKKFDDEKKIFKKLNVKYYTNLNVLKDKVKKLIYVKDTYTFNPIKYLQGLLDEIIKNDNIKIYENSIATDISKVNDYYIVKVNNYNIKTKKVILACNYPHFTIPGFIPFRTYMEKSYITATKVDEKFNINGITSNYPYVSFRYYEDNEDKYFICLSNSSKNSDKINYKKNYDECVILSKKITGKKPCYKWTNTDVLTNDSLPIVGSITKDNKVFIATGYNTWGMTNASISAKVITDLIKENKSNYAKLFEPNRKMNLVKFKNFISNTVISNIKAYTLNFFIKNPSWYKNKVFITKYKGKRVGIYYDEDNKEHIVSNICPHLKCFLTFNEVDKTWDCPCHSSRFDIDGNCIKGPSICSIKFKKN